MTMSSAVWPDVGKSGTAFIDEAEEVRLRPLRGLPRDSLRRQGLACLAEARDSRAKAGSPHWTISELLRFEFERLRCRRKRRVLQDERQPFAIMASLARPDRCQPFRKSRRLSYQLHQW